MSKWIALLFLPTSVLAQSDTVSISDLGRTIGAAEQCGFEVKIDEVLQFVDDRVPASDLGSPDDLYGAMNFGALQVDHKGGVTRAAYCRAVENTAREYGFID